MSITVQVNGDEQTVAVATLGELMTELLAGKPTGFVAVARNGAVVPHAQWADTPLSEGDELEVVRPVPGG